MSKHHEEVWRALAIVLMVCAGCGGHCEIADAMADTASAADLAPIDQARTVDAAVADLTAPLDASALPDAAIPDAVALLDGTSDEDALPADGAIDQTPAEPPTCTISVFPAQGAKTTPFTFTLTATNASSCLFGVDNQQRVPVDCNSMLTLTGQELGGAGLRVAGLIASGPGGNVICLAPVDVFAWP